MRQGLGIRGVQHEGKGVGEEGNKIFFLCYFIKNMKVEKRECGTDTEVKRMTRHDVDSERHETRRREENMCMFVV